MLLAELAKAPIDLQQVRAFVFGEYYLIELHNGKKFDVRDFETILSILRDEFELWREQWVPSMQIKPQQRFVAKWHVLEITPVQKGNFLPAPPVQHMVEQVRQAVTMFNLTGSWGQFNKGNL